METNNKTRQNKGDPKLGLTSVREPGTLLNTTINHNIKLNNKSNNILNITIYTGVG